MLYQFSRPISIQLKPSRDENGKINLKQLNLKKAASKFTKGTHEVSEEVERHPFFQMLVEKAIVLQVGDSSARAKEAIEKAEDKAIKAMSKAAAKAAEAAAELKEAA